MADNPIAIPDAPAIEPDSVKRKNLMAKIQEYKSRAARHRQDIEDLMKAQKLKLEAKIEMLDLAVAELESQLNAIEVD